MNFNKNKWRQEDILELENYLQDHARPQKIVWTQNIIRTSHKLFAIPSDNLRDIAREISKGNYLDFLENNSFSSYEIIFIYGIVLNNLKDFEQLKKYLIKYSEYVDCWALCDILKFKTKHFEKELFELAQTLTKSKHPFTRRIGLKIMFSYTSNLSFINKIFDTLNSFFDEKEYYVNMMVSWLFCEMFIKQREATIVFLKSHTLNNFAINKGIQKCRDSFRVSPEDKEYLLTFKKQ